MRHFQKSTTTQQKLKREEVNKMRFSCKKKKDYIITFNLNKEEIKVCMPEKITKHQLERLETILDDLQVVLRERTNKGI